MDDTINLTDILANHAAWLRGEPDGARADLSEANLCGANLVEADLVGANLVEADLVGANLTGANLCGANLRGADLYRANLAGADLTGADLCGANLDGVYLEGASLDGAYLEGASLILAGQDARGYLYYAYRNAHGVVEIHAGCRQFTGTVAARAHWEQRHLDDPVLHADCLSLVQRIETMAIARGWELEPERQEQEG